MGKRIISYVIAAGLSAMVVILCMLNLPGAHSFFFLGSLHLEQNAYIIDFETGDVVGTTQIRADGYANFLTEQYHGSLHVDDYPLSGGKTECTEVVKSARYHSEQKSWSISYTGLVTEDSGEYTSDFAPYSYDLTVFGEKDKQVVVQIISDGTLGDGCYAVCAGQEDEARTIWMEFLQLKP